MRKNVRFSMSAYGPLLSRATVYSWRDHENDG